MQEAFAGPDYEAEFEDVKKKAIDDELGTEDKKKAVLSHG